MGPTRPFTPPDKKTKTTETTSRTGLGCTAMERLISRAWAIPIGKGLERNRPERTCAYNGLPHSGRSFFGDTRNTPRQPFLLQNAAFPRPAIGQEASVGQRTQPAAAKVSATHGHRKGPDKPVPGNAARSCRQLRPKALCSQRVESSERFSHTFFGAGATCLQNYNHLHRRREGAEYLKPSYFAGFYRLLAGCA